MSGNKKDWSEAKKNLKSFYQLLADELALAFEPNVVASLDVKLLQKVSKNRFEASEIEEDTRKLVSESYRISDFQAKKAAHLRALALSERNLAYQSNDEMHWEKAKDYLEKYYEALKERVA